MLSPKDMIKLEDEKYPEEKIIEKIDNSIRSNFEKYDDYQMAVLEMIVPLRIRNNIAAKYARCGWTYVYHISGQEKFNNFEKTFFYFSKEALSDEIGIEKCFLVQMSKVDYNKFVVYKEDKLIKEFELNGE